MTRHIETFFRHKLLLIAPVLVALAASGWYVRNLPSTYSSTTTVWFDSPLPSASSIDQKDWNAPSPASQANSFLQQLLGTRAFLVKVGHRGPVADAIVRQAALTSDELSPVLLEERVVQRLSPSLASWVVGNQVMRLSMTSDDPALLQGTLNAVVAQYLEEVTATRRTRLEAVVEYYKPRLADAAEEMARTRSESVVYLRANPEVAFGVTDPQYNALAGAASSAQGEYEEIEKQYSQANHALALADASLSSRVIDPATEPTRFSIKKKAIFAGVGALLFGALISLLGLAALTALDTRPRTAGDVERSPEGLRVIGTISEVEMRRFRKKSVM